MITEKKEVLLDVKDLTVQFGSKRHPFTAVDHVNFQIYRGETFGVVGESGSGKTTIGRAIIRINPTSSGEILYNGQKINGRISRSLDREITRKIQMIFQDPMASLNERAKVDYIVSEGLLNLPEKLSSEERSKIVADALDSVGLLPEFASRFPHEFSGGQRQRIGIARALAIEPEFIVCDEPISALDVSIQSQIINLLHDLQQQLGLTFLFIAHDLNIVKYISDRIAVMYLGNVVELASSDDLYAHTLHPYSKALLSAVPIPDPSAEAQKHRQILSGDVPSPINTPKGCNFAGRCPVACDKCRESKPQLREIRPGHFCACHLVEPEI